MPRTAVKSEVPARKARKASASSARKATNGATRPKRLKALTAESDQFGFRKGSLKSKAAAMYASKGGATLAEVKKALKSTQFNLITELEARKFEIGRTQEEGKGPRKVTRYRIMV